MTADVLVFRGWSSGSGPRARASGRVEAGTFHPTAQIDAILQAEILRQTHRMLADCWQIRAESRRIKRDYEERRRGIEVLLANIPIREG